MMDFLGFEWDIADADLMEFRLTKVILHVGFWSMELGALSQYIF